jgi:hypothetical protein
MELHAINSSLKIVVGFRPKKLVHKNNHKNPRFALLSEEQETI